MICVFKLYIICVYVSMSRKLTNFWVVRLLFSHYMLPPPRSLGVQLGR